MLCRDRCGYCTFAQPPARLERPYLTPDEVLRHRPRRRRGRLPRGAVHPGRARPRSATPSPREWLAEHGYASTVDYLVAMCRAGARRDRPAPPRQRRRPAPPTSSPALRAGRAQPGDDDRVAPRRPRLPPRRARQDARRAAWPRSRPPASWPSRSPPASSSASARTAADRIDALEAIAASHRRHGHVQEVIVQNFLPKAGHRDARARRRARPTSYLEADRRWPG